MKLLQIEKFDKNERKRIQKIFDICKKEVNTIFLPKEINNFNKLLMKEPGILCYARVIDNDSSTLLHYISENCHLELAEIFFVKLKAALTEKANQAAKNKDNFDKDCYIRNKILEQINIKKKVPIKTTEVVLKDNIIDLGNALHLACYSGSNNENRKSDMINLLLNNGANLSSKSYWGNVLISVLFQKKYWGTVWLKNTSSSTVSFILKKIKEKFENNQKGLNNYMNETSINGKTAVRLYFENNRYLIKTLPQGQKERKKLCIKDCKASKTLKNIIIMLKLGAIIDREMYEVLKNTNYDLDEYLPTPSDIYKNMKLLQSRNNKYKYTVKMENHIINNIKSYIDNIDIYLHSLEIELSYNLVSLENNSKNTSDSLTSQCITNIDVASNGFIENLDKLILLKEHLSNLRLKKDKNLKILYKNHKTIDNLVDWGNGVLDKINSFLLDNCINNYIVDCYITRYMNQVSKRYTNFLSRLNTDVFGIYAYRNGGKKSIDLYNGFTNDIKNIYKKLESTLKELCKVRKYLIKYCTKQETLNDYIKIVQLIDNGHLLLQKINLFLSEEEWEQLKEWIDLDKLVQEDTETTIELPQKRKIEDIPVENFDNSNKKFHFTKQNGFII